MTEALKPACESIDRSIARLRVARDVIVNAAGFVEQAERLGVRVAVDAKAERVILTVHLAVDDLVFSSAEADPNAARSLMSGGEEGDRAADARPLRRESPQGDTQAEGAAVVAASSTDVGASSRDELCAEDLGPDTRAADPVVEGEEPARPAETEERRERPPIKDNHVVPAAAAAFKTTWSSEEEADLIDRVDRGESYKQIAKATHRKPASVSGKYTYMRSRGLIPAKPTPLAKDPTPDVNLDPRDDFWTAERDLILAEKMAEGRGMSEAAEAAGVAPTEGRRRWNLLKETPDIPFTRARVVERLRTDVAEGA